MQINTTQTQTQTQTPFLPCLPACLAYLALIHIPPFPSFLGPVPFPSLSHIPFQERARKAYIHKSKPLPFHLTTSTAPSQ